MKTFKDLMMSRPIKEKQIKSLKLPNLFNEYFIILLKFFSIKNFHLFLKEVLDLRKNKKSLYIHLNLKFYKKIDCKLLTKLPLKYN
jgi:hypothetical protein